MSSSTTITRNDVIVVQDRYLYTFRESIKEVGKYQPPKQRFLMKGIAFPNAPNLPAPTEGISSSSSSSFQYEINYNATNWISILQQLRSYLPTPQSLNTIRLYELYPQYIDYNDFFTAAASLGFYIIVPLTSNINKAILNRDKHAPQCYTKELWDYGVQAIQTYMQYPNIIAGVVGNEVINSLDSWMAAPCIKAYTRDLQYYMKYTLPKEIQQSTILRQKYQQRIVTIIQSNDNEQKQDDEETIKLLSIPLLYAAQDSGIGAALNEVDTVRLSLDYLTCQNNNDTTAKGKGRDKSSSRVDDSSSTTTTTTKENFGSIDILGVNVESWCSSLDTFQYQDDGTTPGTFYQLWLGLHSSNAHVPLLFSEIGCSHLFYNRDLPISELQNTQSVREIRDWDEIPVVLYDMVDTWSGFCAYAYWGNSLFQMMNDGPWNGRDVLPPGQDFFNFQKQCLLTTNATTTTSTTTTNNTKIVSQISLHPLPLQNGGIMDDYYQLMDSMTESPTCEQVERTLEATINLKLYNWDDMPSYIMTNQEDRSIGTATATTTTTMHSLAPHETEFHNMNGIHSKFTNNRIIWKHRLEAILLIFGIGIIVLAYFFQRQKRKRLRQSYDVIP